MATVALRAMQEYDADWDMTRTWWETSGPIAAVKLANRGGRFHVVIHPSSKRPGIWQFTWFEGDEAVGDHEAATLDEALKDAPPGQWEVVEVRALTMH